MPKSLIVQGQGLEDFWYKKYNPDAVINRITSTSINYQLHTDTNQHQSVYTEDWNKNSQALANWGLVYPKVAQNALPLYNRYPFYYDLITNNK